MTEPSSTEKCAGTAPVNQSNDLAGIVSVLETSPEWCGLLQFDEFRLEVIASRPTPWNTSGVWSGCDDLELTVWLQEHGLAAATETAAKAVQVVARRHPSHPVRTYLESLRWDGKTRIDGWLATYLGVEDNEYSRAVGSRWLVSAVARIFQPGAKVDTVLILEGAQGIGKSQAAKALAGAEWFTDHLPELSTKDSAMQLRGTWILEVAELDALNRAAATAIKSYLSRSEDKFRLPYGRRVESFPRQCVFIGTTNAETYLKDETGNRRFWPVKCGQIALDQLKADRDQLWAEAVARFREGREWWLNTPELIQLAEGEQADRRIRDPWATPIEQMLAGKDDTSLEEIFGVIHKPLASRNRSDEMRVVAILKSLGWNRYRASVQGSRIWRYRLSSAPVSMEAAA